MTGRFQSNVNKQLQVMEMSSPDQTVAVWRPVDVEKLGQSSDIWRLCIFRRKVGSKLAFKDSRRSRVQAGRKGVYAKSRLLD